MLVRIALLLVSLPLLAHGGERLYHAFRSRVQANVTCAQFLRERPSSQWLRLEGCEIDYVRAAYREQRGRVTELFFPLRPIDSSPAQPAAIVVATRDPEVLAIATETLGGDRTPDREALLVMMLKVVTAMRASKEVEGLRRSPLTMLRTRRDLGAIQAALADDFTILDLHRRPHLLYPAIEATAGAQGLLVFAFVTATRRRRAKRLAEPQAPVQSAPARDREFRRLMLLNLPPHAAAAAIEAAPALGSRETVCAALAQVLPGVSFTAEGIAEFSRPDHQIRIDIGRHPDVPTAVVDVTGETAPAALKRLITQTGWRAYSPRLGRFLTFDDLT